MVMTRVIRDTLGPECHLWTLGDGNPRTDRPLRSLGGGNSPGLGQFANDTETQSFAFNQRVFDV